MKYMITMYRKNKIVLEISTCSIIMVVFYHDIYIENQGIIFSVHIWKG